MFDQDKANLQKEEIQFKAVGLSILHDNLLLNWATGTGKTRAVLDIIEAYRRPLQKLSDFSKPPKDVTIYIVLKEVAHKKNWENEFIKYGQEEILQQVHFFCYASLSKFVETKCDILILDECHALSEMREDYLKTIECDRIISLSATVKPEVVQRIRAYKPNFYQYTITLQDAIDRGILPEPIINVVYVTLDDRSKIWGWRQRKSKPRRGLEYITAKQYYDKLVKQIEYWEKRWTEGQQDWAKNKWIGLMGQRKKFMGEVKATIVNKLLSVLDKKRYVCFCSSVEQAKFLGGKEAVYAGVDKIIIQGAIDCFNEGSCKHLFAVKMLREAMNLNGIEAAIIVQLDNQQGSFEQMTGRSLRSIAPEVYVLVLKGTKDEDYFDKATRGISSKYMREYILPPQQD